MLDGIPNEVLASLGAIAGKKAVKDSKKEVSAGEHNVDFVLRIKGYVKKGPQGTSSSSNPAVDFAALFAAAVEGMTEEEIGDVLSLAQSETFQNDYTAQGGKAALHKEVASAMGIPAKIEKPREGSVSCVGLELCEWADGVDLGRAVTLLESDEEEVQLSAVS